MSLSRRRRRPAPPRPAPLRTRRFAVLAPIEEPPDPIIEGRIDLGALAAEFLALGLDPYPRKPGVDFAAPADASAPASPFAVLGRRGRQDRSPDE